MLKTSYSEQYYYLIFTFISVQLRQESFLTNILFNYGREYVDMFFSEQYLVCNMADSRPSRGKSRDHKGSLRVAIRLTRVSIRAIAFISVRDSSYSLHELLNCCRQTNNIATSKTEPPQQSASGCWNTELFFKIIDLILSFIWFLFEFICVFNIYKC